MMPDQIYEFFYFIGKGVLLLAVLFAVFFIFTKTKRTLKSKKENAPEIKP